MPLRSQHPSEPVASEPFHRTLIRAISATIRRDPTTKAFIDAENPNSFITYKEVLSNAYAVASYLTYIGFTRQTAVFVLPNSWEFVSFFLGVALRGGAFSGASAMFTEYELERHFLDSGATVILTDLNHIERVQKAVKGAPLVKTIIVLGSIFDVPPGTVAWDEVITYPVRKDLEVPSIDVDSLLMLPYSSGTTGTPKGVMLSHRNVGTMQQIYRKHVTERVLRVVDPTWEWTGQHIILYLPFYHVFGFGVMSKLMLDSGTGILMKKFDLELFCKTVENYKIRLLNVVPPILVQLSKNPICDRFDLSSVRLIMSGAAAAGKELCDDVRKKYPNVHSIHQSLGMTEATTVSHLPDLTLREQKFGTVGRVAPGLEVKVVDSEAKELGPGEPGEICVRGPTIMKGYLNKPEATRDTIRNGWLHTGDIGYYDQDGDFFVVDRLKELIKVKGLQVPPAELEDLLLSHSKIRDVGVIGIPDADAGELPKAFVVKADQSLTEREVQQYVEAKLSPYKHLKGGVEFVSEIPKSPTGKILRRLLREQHKQQSRSKL